MAGEGLCTRGRARGSLTSEGQLLNGRGMYVHGVRV